MKYKEINGDLFEVDESYRLVHCISADFEMSRGIAVEFDKRFNTKSFLKRYFPNYIKEQWVGKLLVGDCILTGRVLNLITKYHYFDKPTYSSIRASLNKLKDICIKLNIEKIAMPKIGCGLDRLQWKKVRNILINVFDRTNIDVLVVNYEKVL